MRNFEKVLDGGKPRRPSDVATIQQKIPELAHLTPGQVELIYIAFSDTYAAGWMNLGEDMLEAFRDWALSECEDDEDLG